MITIGLDEHGHFELEDFSFIAGVVYDGDDYKEEEIRILNFLKCFVSIPSEYVPHTSVLREFIGNSYFE